ACIEIAFLVFTISTSLPLLNMGVMTMKMMSMTSITSTMGVTLISATGGGALCFTISSTLTGIVSLFSYTGLRQVLRLEPWAGAGELCWALRFNQLAGSESAGPFTF